jgi:hypothetical protein
MSLCKNCNEPLKNRYFCHSCNAVFICPNSECNEPVKNSTDTVCSHCNLIFIDYITLKKRYKQCTKCKKKQGLYENPCKYCRRYFQCPECGYKFGKSVILSCPKCGRSMR